MLTRIITAAVALLLFIPVLLFSDTIVYDIIIALMACMAAYELLKCADIDKQFILSVPALAVSLALPLMIRYISFRFIGLILIVFVFFLLFSLIFAKGKFTFKHVSIVFFTVVYIGISFTSLIIVREMKYGEYIYLLIFIGAWSTDTFAFFFGKFFGKHKLIPEISPKKTIEGSIGGIICCAAAFNLYGYIIYTFFTQEASPNYIALSIIGVCASIIAQLGDLAASAIKRNFGRKDYGSVFPGHGGILDRFDSVMTVGPFIMIISAILKYFVETGMFL